MIIEAQKIKKFVFLTGLLFLLIIIPPSAMANSKYASIVMDADTGMILHQRYADKMLHPASLTKIMTLVMVFDALDQGKLRLNDRIRISKHAASMVPSKLDLPAGSSIKVKDAIYSLVTKSANDIAVAIAEKLGKTERRFGVMMTKKAREMGMSRTRFVNASGLHHPKQISTARDMAKLARYLLIHYPNHYKYFSTRNFSYRGKSYRNHNKLMASYNGMDGIKTGYIQASGFNLVASAKRNDRRIIGVVFGGRSSKTRNAHMKKLLDNGFAKVKKIRLAKQPPVPGEKPLNQLASLQTRTRIASAANNNDVIRLSDLSNAPSRIDLDELAGEGDIDTELLNRFETGLLTASVHTGTRYQKTETPPQKKFKGAALPSRGKTLNHKERNIWSIQIGAFSDRTSTNQILHSAHTKLPTSLKHSTPFIAPVKAENGWMYRAWLSGFNEQEALLACRYYKDCLIIKPSTYQ